MSKTKVQAKIQSSRVLRGHEIKSIRKQSQKYEITISNITYERISVVPKKWSRSVVVHSYFPAQECQWNSFVNYLTYLRGKNTKRNLKGLFKLKRIVKRNTLGSQFLLPPSSLGLWGFGSSSFEVAEVPSQAAVMCLLLFLVVYYG